MTRGKFITIEGGEGAGKSTQIRRLAGALQAKGLGVTMTREPGGSPGAEQIRELLVKGDTGRWSPTSEMLLHFAARRDHLEKTVWPALDAGRWVISDRFADSTVAYQGYAQGLGREAVERAYALAVGDFAPDLTLILDLPPEEGLKRARARASGGEDRYERMGLDFHRKLREAFLDIAQAHPHRCRVIDALGDEEAVAERIAAALTKALKP